VNEIHEFLTVLIPFEHVPASAQAYAASLVEKGEKRTAPIRITVGDIVVERIVDLTLRHARAYPGFEIMDIGWGPHDGGPYPVFTGTLSVEQIGTTFSRLDLDGTYAPPMGIAGAMIDAVVGHRFAVSGARSLLNDIKNGLETAYRAGVAT
jgi:hypothetical protein